MNAAASEFQPNSFQGGVLSQFPNLMPSVSVPAAHTAHPLFAQQPFSNPSAGLLGPCLPGFRTPQPDFRNIQEFRPPATAIDVTMQGGD